MPVGSGTLEAVGHVASLSPTTTRGPPQYTALYLEKTKLSVTQIKHALPHWMFVEVVQEEQHKTPPPPPVPSPRISPQHQAPTARPGSAFSGGKSSSANLMRCISQLPPHYQRCFSGWRRERSQAINNSDMNMKAAVEKVMWSALVAIYAA